MEYFYLKNPHKTICQNGSGSDNSEVEMSQSSYRLGTGYGYRILDYT